jgi:hypothetical protein
MLAVHAITDGERRMCCPSSVQILLLCPYCRVPRNLKELVESGQQPSVVFEGGSVLRCVMIQRQQAGAVPVVGSPHQRCFLGVTSM